LYQLHQFRNEPLELLLAALSAAGGGMRASTAWQNLQLQKFMHREIRIWDSIIKGKKIKYSKKNGRWAQYITLGLSDRLGDKEEDESEAVQESGEGDDEEVATAAVPQVEDGGDENDEVDVEGIEIGEDQETPLPQGASPELNFAYGQHMLSGRAHQSALCELISPHTDTS
jgi:hypothetical protein